MKRLDVVKRMPVIVGWLLVLLERASSLRSLARGRLRLSLSHLCSLARFELRSHAGAESAARAEQGGRRELQRLADHECHLLRGRNRGAEEVGGVLSRSQSAGADRRGDQAKSGAEHPPAGDGDREERGHVQAGRLHPAARGRRRRRAWRRWASTRASAASTKTTTSRSTCRTTSSRSWPRGKSTSGRSCATPPRRPTCATWLRSKGETS